MVILPDIGEPFWNGCGPFMVSKPGVSGTSCCQPHQVNVYPFSRRNAFPGSHPEEEDETSGELFNILRIKLRPRFGTSKTNLLFPFSGIRILASEENLTI